MFTTHLLNATERKVMEAGKKVIEAETMLKTVKEELDKQEKYLDMAKGQLDILSEFPIEIRDDFYYDLVEHLSDNYKKDLKRYGYNVMKYSKLSTQCRDFWNLI